MEGLVMTAQLLLGLAVLVTLHEFGHYVTARMFDMRVDRFYIFFDAWGKKLFSFKKGDTEFGIGWLPIGGYVKIAGMIDESLDTEALKAEPQPWEFRSKPAWQRLIVMLGGVTVNVILGILIFSMMTWGYGESYLPIDQVNKHGIVALDLGKEIGFQTGDKLISINNRRLEKFKEILGAEVILGDNVVFNVNRGGNMIDIPIPVDFAEKFTDAKGNTFIEKRHTYFIQEVFPNSNAEKGGILPNDEILTINGQGAKFFDQLTTIFQENKGKEVNILVSRNNREVPLNVQVGEDGKVGLTDFEYAHLEYSLSESFVLGNRRAWSILYENIKGLGKIFRGEISASKSLHGPIGIATIYGGVWDWKKFWIITGLLSMVLAFVNILPIPALDGGHAMFLIMEMVSGKALSDKFLERTQIAGIIILLSLMTFIIGNDIWKHILN